MPAGFEGTFKGTAIDASQRGGDHLEEAETSVSQPLKGRHVEDFDDLEMPPKEIKDLQTCRVGNCTVKLSESAVKELRAAIDWDSPTAIADANTFMQRRAYEFVAGYHEGGNRRLGVYRDSQHLTFVAEQFESMVERLPTLAAHLPDLRRYLLDYPRASLPGASSFLYWQEVDFGLLCRNRRIDEAVRRY